MASILDAEQVSHIILCTEAGIQSRMGQHLV